MEAEALDGARRTIQTCEPITMVEHIKASPGSLQALIKDIAAA